MEDALDLVDPEQRSVVAAMPRPDPAADLERFRRGLVEGQTRLLTPSPVPVEERSIPVVGRSSGLRMRIHRGRDAPDADAPLILYAHGGGLIAGTPDMMDGVLSRHASATGSVVVAIDYRLAPEHPFPAALDDCMAALAWARSAARGLGASPDRISVMGDSAGGTLAAAMALTARDRGGPPVRAQILLYPALDMRTGSEGHRGDPVTGRFVWTRAANRYAWDAVRGASTPTGIELGRLSPALARDLVGLPPAVVMVGSLDLFRPEDVAYAQRLMSSRVPTDLFVHAGGVHGFDALGGALASRATSQLHAAMRTLL